jgi:ATP-dependent protease ClpP protease subunit
MQRKEQKAEKLNSNHHTLFKSRIETKEIRLSANTFKREPAHTKFRLFIDSFMERERGLHEIFNELWNANEFDTLELRINSRGGLVNEGSQFYSIIKNKFYNKTTTVLDSCGYSMGALTFCMGDKRVVTPRSDLMFHDYSGGISGKGGEIKSRYKHSAKHLRKFFKDVILKNNFLSKSEFKQMLIGKDFWMDAKELCQRGIATHVLINEKEISAKKYLKNLKKQ